MSDLIIYRQCPSCKSAAISKEFSCKDHTATELVFEIWKCSKCTLRFTQRPPDEDHIGPFYQTVNYVSHSDTKTGLVNKLYHAVRRYTLRSKRLLVNKATGLATGTLLDAGAGTGAFANTMQKAGWAVTGLEPDATARANALANYNLAFSTPEKLYSLPAESFDAITLWHVLEHVHNLNGYLSSFHHILKSEGRLFIAVPNYTSYDAKVYQNVWAAYDVPRHLYHFSPKSMHILLKEHGFVIEQIKPMWFDSFYVSMLSEKYMKEGSMWRGIKIGLQSNFKALRDKRKCSSLIYIIRKA